MTRIAPILALFAAACTPAADDTASSPSSGPAVTASAEPTPQGSSAPVPASTETRSAQDIADTDDACGTAKVESYIGKEATAAVRSTIARESGAGSARWLYPDSMVTEDFSPSRLNVTMEKGTDIIVSMRCG